MITCASAPSSQATSTPSTVANTPAISSVSTIGQNNWRIRRRLRNSGTARATVAGPSSRLSGCVLLR